MSWPIENALLITLFPNGVVILFASGTLKKYNGVEDGRVHHLLHQSRIRA